MTTPRRAATTPLRIVLGTPTGGRDTDATRGIAAWVLEHATRWTCPVVVVQAWPDGQGNTREDAWTEPEHVGTHSGAAVATVLSAHGLRVSAVTRNETTAHALLSVARPGDLVVIGAQRGRLFRTAFSGSTVHRLLHDAPCPVAVIPELWRTAVSKLPIMVAFDDTDLARAALHWGLSECQASASRLVLVRADTPAAEEASVAVGLLAQVRALAAPYAVTDVSLLDVSNAGMGTAHALDEAAAGAGLLVLGNHRAGWLTQLSRAGVAERAVAVARTPIVIVPRERPVRAATRAPSRRSRLTLRRPALGAGPLLDRATHRRVPRQAGAAQPERSVTSRSPSRALMIVSRARIRVMTTGRSSPVLVAATCIRCSG